MAINPQDFPALDGRVVTQAHAAYCEINGHASYMKDGEVQPLCPRCGVRTVLEVEPVVDSVDKIWVWWLKPNTDVAVVGEWLGHKEGKRGYSRVRREDDGKVYLVPSSVLRRM